MAISERGEVPIAVEGKVYTLRPSFNAVCALEDLTGKNIDTLFSLIEQRQMSGLRSAVWCLLQDAHKDEIRTLEDAGNWIQRAGGPLVIWAELKQLEDLNAPTAETTGERGATNPRKARAGGGTGKRLSRALSRRA